MSATSAATAATKLVPENNATVVNLNDRAVSLFNKGHYDQSIAVLDQIIGRFPDSGLAYANRGAVYFQLDKFDEAIKDYTQAIGLGRNEAVVMLNRGTAYFKKGDYDRALEDCNAIIRITPRNAVAYRTCGIAYEAKGDSERAFSNFDESVRLDPRAPKTYVARGLAYARSRQPEKALTDLKQATRLDSSIGKETEVAKAVDQANAAVSKAPPAVAVVAPPKPPEQVAAATPAASQVAPDGEIRVALVIGNSNYSAVPRLPNPQVDAAAVAASLRAAGFKTATLDDNLGAAAMRQALNDFSSEAAKADWAMVYYAGHGIEVSGTNYLIPTPSSRPIGRWNSKRYPSMPFWRASRVHTSCGSWSSMPAATIHSCATWHGRRRAVRSGVGWRGSSRIPVRRWSPIPPRRGRWRWTVRSAAIVRSRGL